MIEKEVRRMVLNVLDDLLWRHEGVFVPSPHEGGDSQEVLDPQELRRQVKHKLEDLGWE